MIRCHLYCCQKRVDLLASVSNRSIPVTVENQEAFGRADPACVIGQAVPVEIKTSTTISRRK
jgi:hypothetical protein